ncbi:MAG: DUF126 domain-containing protein [Methanomassiliicoccales archaeon]
MIIRGRSISRGKAEGEVLLLESDFSFLGGVNPKTGILTNATTLEGQNIRGRVFAFNRGKGSTVGSYTILQLKRERNLPAAIINRSAETIVATGAVMAGIPMVDSIDISLLKSGDVAKVDGDNGIIELPAVRQSDVVTAVLMHKGRILALKRSDKVSSCQNMWAGVSGYLEKGEKPLERAIKEVEEETAVKDCTVLHQAPPLTVRQGDMAWTVHAFLMACPTEKIRIDWEHSEYKWIDPSSVDEHVTVPGFLRVLRSLGL